MNPQQLGISSRSYAHALHKFKFSEVFSWFQKLQRCPSKPPNDIGLVHGRVLRQKYYNVENSRHCCQVKTMNPQQLGTSSRSYAHALHKFKFSEVYSWFQKLQRCPNKPPNGIGRVHESVLRQKFYNSATSSHCWDVKPRIHRCQLLHPVAEHMLYINSSFRRCIRGFKSSSGVQTSLQTVLDLFMKACLGRNIITCQLQVTVGT